MIGKKSGQKVTMTVGGKMRKTKIKKRRDRASTRKNIIQKERTLGRER